jgi:hypothetical protein
LTRQSSRAEGIEGLVDQARVAVQIGDVADQKGAMPAALENAGKRLLGILIALEVDQHQIEAGGRKGERAAAPVAAPAAGRERDRPLPRSVHDLLRPLPPHRRDHMHFSGHGCPSARWRHIIAGRALSSRSGGAAAGDRTSVTSRNPRRRYLGPVRPAREDCA